MAINPRNIAKLNTDLSSLASQPGQTPATGSGIKLSFFRRPDAPATPDTSSQPTGAQVEKAKRKYTKKDKAVDGSANSKKRPRDDKDDEDAIGQPGSARKVARAGSSSTTIRIAPSQSLAKKTTIKIRNAASQPPTPVSAVIGLKLKHKGKPPVRPLGVGYDTDASDAEADPSIQENFILRMPPGPDSDYIRAAINERRIGVPLKEGGADLSIRFLSRDARRAMVTVQGRHYAAVLVDLPCIIESMKSWDKRGWWKSADICQMLLVTGRVNDEEAAKTVPLPAELDEKTMQWPHGLTPPMYNVRKRRFRKRVSYRTIEKAEEEVNRLIKADEEAEKFGGKTEYKIDEWDRLVNQDAQSPGQGYEEYDDTMDAEGEVDEDGIVFDGGEVDEDEHDTAAIAAQMELDLLNEVDHGDIVSNALPETTENITMEAVDSTAPILAVETSQETGESDDEGDDEENSGEEADSPVDVVNREQAQLAAQQREEIAEIERDLAENKIKLNQQQNPMFKQRITNNIRRLEGELQVKKLGLGEQDDAY